MCKIDWLGARPSHPRQACDSQADRFYKAPVDSRSLAKIPFCYFLGWLPWLGRVGREEHRTSAKNSLGDKVRALVAEHRTLGGTELSKFKNTKLQAEFLATLYLV